MKFKGHVPVYKSFFIIAGGDLAGVSFDYGSQELCLRMTPPHSAVVICGAQQGDPTLTCEGRDSRPAALVTVPSGWDEGMEVSLDTSTPLMILESAGQFPLFDGQTLIDHIGWTRIRVLARGRIAARADPDHLEEYLITAWADDCEREAVTLGTS